MERTIGRNAYGRWKTVSFVLICLYRIFLDVSYYYVVAPLYDYDGFKAEYTAPLVILSWLLLFTSFLLIRPVLAPPNLSGSSMVVFVLYVASFVPFTTCVSSGTLSNGAIFGNAVYWAVFLMAQRLGAKREVQRFYNFRLSMLKVDEHVAVVIIAILSMLVLYVSYRYTGLRLHFDLTTVYDLRTEALSYHMPTLILYARSIARNLLPIYIGYLFLKKRYLPMIVLWGVQVLHFGVDGAKSVFFIPIAIVMIILVFKRFTMEQYKNIILVGLIALNLLGICERVFFDTYWLERVLIRRVMFVPINLHEAYYSFFSTHEPDYWRGSFLRHFGFSSPYVENPGEPYQGIPYAIGSFLGHPHMGANNGMFSDAVANMGIGGVLLLPLVVVVLLRIFDYCSAGVDRRLVFAASLPIAFPLISSSLGTALLTHGIIFMMLFFSMLGRKRKAVRSLSQDDVSLKFIYSCTTKNTSR